MKIGLGGKDKRLTLDFSRRSRSRVKINTTNSLIGLLSIDVCIVEIGAA